MTRFIPAVSIISILSLIFLAYFIWWPEYQNFSEKMAILDVKEKTLIEKENHFNQLRDFAAKLERYKEQVAKIDLALPQEISEADIFEFLQRKTSENGLILDSITSSGVAKTQQSAQTNPEGIDVVVSASSRISKISFSMSLSGRYDSFKNYLSELYSNARIFDVDSINFSSGASSSAAPGQQPQPKPAQGDIFNFTLKITTNYLAK